jgi:hypothetical protein
MDDDSNSNITLEKEINEIFQPLIAQMVVQQPDDPIKYMIEWLMRFAGEKQNGKLYNELKSLRKRVDKQTKVCYIILTETKE